ncbi:FG-GAP-like repeat-containing protein [Bacteroides salyersiae]|nr:FG-GAP-like repeat-containing protein [Bacteroides salyersiae]
MKKKMKRNMKKNMKKKILLSVVSFSLAVGAGAHDDLIYRTQAGWNFDIGNQSVISQTLDAVFTGGACVGDYDGDGRVDICEVETTGEMIKWVWKINNGKKDWITSTPVSFGISATDKYVTGDFNGDGKTDIAVMRSGAGGLATWYIDFSPCEGNIDARGQFGLPGDIPLSGDFNGDGIDDLAVYRPSTSTWYVAFSSLTGYPEFDMPLAINGVVFGTAEDVPFTGDFNGDGYTDMALYRASTGQILINYWSADKPQYEHYADSNGYGTVDCTVTVPLTGVLAVMSADADQSRPAVLPLATLEETGKEVNLRHGWTCIFDNSLDVDKWARNLEAAGINTLEYHPWMRAHEEVAPQTETWNTYVGDDRLWTSKAMMKKKIEKFHSIGGRSVCYTGIYAATPAFAHTCPDWAMRNAGDRSFITYGGSYLYLMSTNESVDAPYTIGGETYKNFNDYFVHQAVTAQKEYNWDGYRWDWYGLPDSYVCDGTEAACNFSSEMAPLVKRLDLAVKEQRADVTTTALQLPSTNGNIPHYTTGAVANHQFMELWPFGTGTKYTDLYRDIYEAKSRYPDKPVFANFYPPAEMNLTTGWPKQNIDYQFATCLSAGGYPAAQVVDGVASFTDPVPFHAVNYPLEVLEQIARWNKFTEAYGAYLYYSNRAYVIADYNQSDLVLDNADGIYAKLKRRWDKRTGRADALIVDLVNYGSSVDLRWDVVNTAPAAKATGLSFTLPEDAVPADLYCVTLEGSRKVDYTREGDKVKVSLSSLGTFATLVLHLNSTVGMPEAPAEKSVAFDLFPFRYDAGGETLRSEETAAITILDDQEPLIVSNDYNGNVSQIQTVTDAFAGEKALQVTPGMIRFTTTSDGAIRVPLDRFNRFKIAVRSHNTTACWFGFRLIKPSDSSPVWETKDLFYRVGYSQPGLAYLTLTPVKPKVDEWVEYERDLREDITGLWGEDWADAIVVSVFMGPVDRNSADYDNLIFMSDKYTGIESSKKKEEISVCFDDGGSRMIISGGTGQERLCEIRLADMGGRICYEDRLRFGNGVLSCSIPPLSQGAYLLTISDVEQEGYHRLYASVVFR